MGEKHSYTGPAKLEINEEKVAEYIRVSGLARELSEDEQKQFTQFCVSYQLDPFRGEVHCSVYGEGEYRNANFIVSFLTYIKRAELSGRLDGWAAEIEGEGENTEAVVTIWRKDWSHEFRHRVHWKEAVQKKRDGTLTAFWKKMPRYLLKKTAIAQAFRLAFPAELGGMGYDESELSEELSPAALESEHHRPPARPSPNRVAATPQRERTIAFPALPTDSAIADPGREELTVLIRGMLSTNALAFPRAHAEWIERELAKDPNEERLHQILDHMSLVLGESDNTEAKSDSKPEPVEELIF